MSKEITLRMAVNREIPLRLKYYPNLTGETLVGWRNVLPLDLYSYRGKQYLLGYFTGGSSVTGLDGYRLYLANNIKEFEAIDTTKQQPFALAKGLYNTKVKAFLMIKRGKIE